MTANKFKIGDRVKQVDVGAVNFGKKATIVGYHIKVNTVYYLYDDGFYGSSNGIDMATLELVEKCKCNCCEK